MSPHEWVITLVSLALAVLGLTAISYLRRNSHQIPLRAIPASLPERVHTHTDPYVARRPGWPDTDEAVTFEERYGRNMRRITPQPGQETAANHPEWQPAVSSGGPHFVEQAVPAPEFDPLTSPLSDFPGNDHATMVLPIYDAVAGTQNPHRIDYPATA